MRVQPRSLSLAEFAFIEMRDPRGAPRDQPAGRRRRRERERRTRRERGGRSPVPHGDTPRFGVSGRIWMHMKSKGGKGSFDWGGKVPHRKGHVTASLSARRGAGVGRMPGESQRRCAFTRPTASCFPVGDLTFSSNNLCMSSCTGIVFHHAGQ